MTENDSFGDWLRKFRESAGLSQAEMSRRTGLTANYLSQLERGRREPSDSARMLFGLLEEQERSAAGRLEEKGAEYGLKERVRTVPVLGWAHAGAAVDYEERDGTEVVPTECPDPQAYAVRLEGDSMLPQFDEGNLLVLMPSAQAYSGGYVVARFVGSEGVIFRRLEAAGSERFRLVPENTRYPVTEHGAEEFAWLVPVWGVWMQLYKRKDGDDE